MAEKIYVRYGRNYQIILGIVLPCLLIIPFIFVMQAFKTLDEWKVWTIIFLFLGAIASLCLCIVLSAYPPAILSVENKIISLSFERKTLFGRSDFTFNVADITSLNRKEIGTTEYVVFTIKHPVKKFQVSPRSYDWDDDLKFSTAMDEIANML
jgi:hypothetical protein